MEKVQKSLSFVIIFIAAITILFLSQIFTADFRIKILNVFRLPLKMISCSCYVLRDVSDFNEIHVENKILKENVANLEKEVLGLREANLENERLKELLDFKKGERRKYIPAMMIARDPSGARDTIIIDKGKVHDVQRGMAVVSGNGLVGRVRESGWSISRVLLITDRDSVVSGIVQRTRDEGALVGDRQSGLIMKYLDLGCGVKQGDKVLTSGFSGIFEKGILIGEVVSLEEDASGLYLNAIIRSEVEMGQLEEVLVIP